MSAEVVLDHEATAARENPNSILEYVEIVDPFAKEISFLKSECRNASVLRIVCDELGKFSTPYYFSVIDRYTYFVSLIVRFGSAIKTSNR